MPQHQHQVPSPYAYQKYQHSNQNGHQQQQQQQQSEYGAHFNEEIDLDNLLSYRQFESIMEDASEGMMIATSANTTSQHNASKFETSNIVHEILYESELCRAGVLFTLENDLLLADFPITIEILKKIIDSKCYINNLNQQSIVEIVLTKCITALKYATTIHNTKINLT